MAELFKYKYTELIEQGYRISDSSMTVKVIEKLTQTVPCWWCKQTGHFFYKRLQKENDIRSFLICGQCGSFKMLTKHSKEC